MTRSRRWIAGWAMAGIAGYVGFETLRVRGLIARSRALSPVAFGQHRVGEGRELSFWVMGDSLAAGYGASSFATSLVGRVASGLAAGRAVVVTNVAVSGATMNEVLAQPRPTDPVDLLMVVAGSNDLVQLKGAGDLQHATIRLISQLGPGAGRTVVVGPGVVADAGLIPVPARPLYRWLRPRYVSAIAAAVAGQPKALHVDPATGAASLAHLYGPTVSAVDQFHLSDEGHRWWADRILVALAGDRTTPTSTAPR